MSVLQHYKKVLGQTLIEALVTILFVSVSIIALVKFQNYLSYDQTLTQQNGEATLIAIKQLETLRDYQVIENTSGYTAYQNIASATSTVTGINAVYTVTSTVTTYTDPDYKRLNVTVSWTDRYGTAQSVQMSTYVGSIDPSNSASVA